MSIGKIRLIALVGLILSAYAVYVEYKIEAQHAAQEERDRLLAEAQAEAQAAADESSSDGTTTLAPSRLQELLQADPLEEFQSLCDIEAIGASCSKVFSLPEGKMLSLFGIVPHGHVLDVPNAVLGCIYYTLVLVLVGMASTKTLVKRLIQFATLMAFSSSVFLAYQLTFVVHDLCVLCWSTHVLNTTLLVRLVLRPSLTWSTTTTKPKKH